MSPARPPLRMARMETNKQLRGLIIRSQSGFYTVETSKGLVTCQLRGRLKQGPRLGDVAAIGDRVRITLLEDGQGVIETIEPRKKMLTRMAPTPSGEYQQIIIANPDQAVFVFACADPAPRLGMLDRFLVMAEWQELPALIVANKIDLVTAAAARELFGDFTALGYPVLYTSVRTGVGIQELQAHLAGSISALTGPSGAGKSSLLNQIIPDLDLEEQAVSEGTRKGKHTTVFRTLYPLGGKGYVADTPGLKALALWDIEPEELDAYFPELRERVPDCQFSNCTHMHEPGCAVLEALGAGLISQRRYESYCRMRLGELEDNVSRG